MNSVGIAMISHPGNAEAKTSDAPAMVRGSDNHEGSMAVPTRLATSLFVDAQDRQTRKKKHLQVTSTGCFCFLSPKRLVASCNLWSY